MQLVSWETSFVAMTVALGAAPDDALASLGESASPAARHLAASIKSPSKTQRAQSLAAALGPIARAVAECELGGGA